MKRYCERGASFLRPGRSKYGAREPSIQSGADEQVVLSGEASVVSQLEVRTDRPSIFM